MRRLVGGAQLLERAAKLEGKGGIEILKTVGWLTEEEISGLSRNVGEIKMLQSSVKGLDEHGSTIKKLVTSNDPQGIKGFIGEIENGVSLARQPTVKIISNGEELTGTYNGQLVGQEVDWFYEAVESGRSNKVLREVKTTENPAKEVVLDDREIRQMERYAQLVKSGVAEKAELYVQSGRVGNVLRSQISVINQKYGIVIEIKGGN